MTLTVHDGLASIASGMGLGADKRSAHFYRHRSLTWQEIEARYRSSWLARKVVDLPASEMCRPKRNWQADGTDIAALEELERRIGLWPKIEEALRLARMGGAVMVIGAMQGDVSQPLRAEALSANSLAYLHVMSKEEVSLGPIELDPGSPLYGQPAYYEVMGNTTMVRLHPSRVIPFKGRYVPRRGVDQQRAFWGDSELDAIDDAIRNADSAQNSFAALIEEAKVDVWGVPGLIDMMLDAEREQQLVRRFTLSNTMKSTHNAVIKDSLDTWDTRQLSTSGWTDIITTYIAVVAGAASMPATVLMGKSPDGMNATGDGDLQNWERTLDGWREATLRPALDYLDEILVRSALGDKPADVWWSFGPLREASEAEVVTVVKAKADLIKVAIDAGAPAEPLLDTLAQAMVESEAFPGLDALIDDYRKSLEEPEEPELPEEEAGLTQAAPLTADAASRPLYVSRKVQNVADLKEWAQSQGLPELQDDLHVTVAFSRQPVDWIKMGQDYRDFNGKGTGELVIAAGGPRVVEPLGDRTAVLMFANSDLSWRNMEMREAGASWDHADYQPHISLTGDTVDLSTVEPYRGKIVLGPEIFEDLKND